MWFSQPAFLKPLWTSSKGSGRTGNRVGGARPYRHLPREFLQLPFHFYRFLRKHNFGQTWACHQVKTRSNDLSSNTPYFRKMTLAAINIKKLKKILMKILVTLFLVPFIRYKKFCWMDCFTMVLFNTNVLTGDWAAQKVEAEQGPPCLLH